MRACVVEAQQQEGIMKKIKRAWGIRHTRAFIFTIKINRHYAAWEAQGLPAFHNESDWDVVRKIRAGLL